MADSPKTKFQGIWDSIKAGAADLSTIEVTTLTGDINVILQKGTDGKVSFISKDGLMTAVEASAKEGATGKIQVVAYTRIDFDQDAVNFVKAGMEDADQKLYDLHLNTLKASQEARTSFIKFLTDLFSA